MFLFVLFQVLFRYLIKVPFFTNNPLTYSEEIAKFSYVWITFIGISLATKRREHIIISFFFEKLPVKIKNYINIAVEVGSLGLLIYLFVWGVIFANFNKIIVSPALEISEIVVTISVPIGFALTVIRVIDALFEDIKKIKTHIDL